MTLSAKSCFFAFMMLFASLLTAQTKPVNNDRGAASKTESVTDKEDADLAKELKLSKEQSVQFKKINKDYKVKAKAVKKSKKSDLRKLHADRKAAHKAILNDEQDRRYDEIVGKREAKQKVRNETKIVEKKEAKVGKKEYKKMKKVEKVKKTEAEKASDN